MKRILIFLVDFYRVAISPYFPPSCRYQPTCSMYAKQAIQEHGALKGTWLAVKRIGRCHPWSEGGFDPVPGTNNQENESDQVCKNHETANRHS